MNAGLTVEVAMQHSPYTRHRGVCDKMLVGLMFCTVLHATEALAGEQASVPGTDAHPELGVRRSMPLSASMASIPERFQAGTLPEPATFSNEEFRPRAHSTLSQAQAPASHNATLNDEPIGGTLLQRFADFRARNQVRLVTLWEAGRSSLSLQAGRKGSPSLQWTSRLMNRGDAPRGLLDELLPESLGSAVSRGLLRASQVAHINTGARPGKSGDLGAGPIR
jgi:hypothetical protein